MKRVSRAQLRGQKLDDDCKRYGHTTTNEYGREDKRVYCCGLYNLMTDEPLEKCKVCKAFVKNEKEPEDA